MTKKVMLLLFAMLTAGTGLGAILMAFQQGKLICHRMTYHGKHVVQHSVTREYFNVYEYISYADKSLDKLAFFQYPEVTICTVEVE